MRQSKVQKKRDNYNYIFIQKPTFRRFIPSFKVLKGPWRNYNVTFPSVSSLSGNNNIIQYFILSRTTLHSERGDRGECHIVFSSLGFQNPEEGWNKPPKRRLWIKIKNSYNYLSFFEPWIASSKSIQFTYQPVSKNYLNRNIFFIFIQGNFISKTISIIVSSFNYLFIVAFSFLS